MIKTILTSTTMKVATNISRVPRPLWYCSCGDNDDDDFDGDDGGSDYNDKGVDDGDDMNGKNLEA